MTTGCLDSLDHRLHLVGIAFGLPTQAPIGAMAVRAAGVVIAVAGGWFLDVALA